MQTDTTEGVVRLMLGHWGRTFALHRDSVSIPITGGTLQRIKEYGDGARAGGSKPLMIDGDVMLIEDIVRGIFATDPLVACTLRAYYCQCGRRSVERYEKAMALAGRKFSRSSFYNYHDQGVEQVKRAYLRYA